MDLAFGNESNPRLKRMIKLTGYAALVIIGLCGGFWTGCGKKAVVDPTVIEGASKLPGAADVMTALDKKDYDGAVSGLVEVQRAVSTDDEQKRLFWVLHRQVKDKLIEAAATDPNAAGALNAVRAMATGGR
jgi:hypothetical protein